MLGGFVRLELLIDCGVFLLQKSRDLKVYLVNN